MRYTSAISHSPNFFPLHPNQTPMQTSLFDYHLPKERIAQLPAEPRDSSRLLVLKRATGAITHTRFSEIGRYLHAGDLLVGNNSRVLPARIPARKPTGGAAEILLLRQLDDTGTLWNALVRGRVHVGSTLLAGEDGALVAEIAALHEDGTRDVRFGEAVRPWLDAVGEMPLPPYITAYGGDRERYQTIYSQPEGSAAAPTAGLHFTPDLLLRLRDAGVSFATVTLHVGLDTFKPVEADEVEDHRIHTEWAHLSTETAAQINQTTLAGGRVVAIGTTSVRTLEWAATAAQGIDPYASPDVCPWQRVSAFGDNVRLFIHPGYRFRAVDALITNFHLPRSSLLMLVSAFVQNGLSPDADPDAGRRILLDAYAEAIREEYRFFSFGDAMLIL